MLVSQHTEMMPAEQFTHELSAVCGSYTFDLGAKRKEVWGGVKRIRHDDWDIALVATDMKSAVKSHANIKRDQSDDVFLILQQSGRSHMTQNGHDVQLNAGDLMLIDSTSPSEFIFSGEPSMQMSLHLPRHQLTQRFGHEIMGGAALRADNLTSRAIHAIFGQMCADDISPDKARLQREVLYGLLGIFFMETGGVKPPEAQTADMMICARAEAVLARHFRDPNLSGDRIAHELGVSLRRLQRAFNASGDTLTQVLMTKRLNYAQNLLISPVRGQNLRTVTAIAFEAGFSDISYFNRSFRKAFGCSPRDFVKRTDVRNAARRRVSAAPLSSD